MLDCLGNVTLTNYKTNVQFRGALGNHANIHICRRDGIKHAGCDSRLTVNIFSDEANDRLLVIADNCEDDTAIVAATAGAEVIERHDLARRGKGYALESGLRHLGSAAPEPCQPPLQLEPLPADDWFFGTMREAIAENRRREDEAGE